MLDIFRGLKGLVKAHSVTIDSSIFRLHYSVSVTFLLAFSLIVTTRQYVGNPIDCVHTKDIPEDVLNTYCWIHSTYTIPSAFWKRIGIDVAHPGIDKTIDPEERRYVRYYQWVCFCLFFQVTSVLLRAGARLPASFFGGGCFDRNRPNTRGSSKLHFSFFSFWFILALRKHYYNYSVNSRVLFGKVLFNLNLLIF